MMARQFSVRSSAFRRLADNRLKAELRTRTREVAVQLELQCSQCSHRFTKPPNAELTLALDRLAEEGPWSALGDGETLEDRVFASLGSSDNLRCADCGAPMAVTETFVGRFTKELLARW